MTDLKKTAALALSCLDLTNLDDDCDAAAIEDLCSKAVTRHGPVAAVCIRPVFVAQAVSLLRATPVRVATVVNFPFGQDSISDVRQLTAQAVSDGADEIDMVIPWNEVLEGHSDVVSPTVRNVRSAAGSVTLKAILETGMLESPELIAEAARQAIDGGADFLKTSTGKASVNATPKAARIVLEVVRDSGAAVGFKPSGGVRTTEAAAEYIELANEIMGDGWVTPQTFRIGSARLLDNLLAVLDGSEIQDTTEGGY
jgi:deoxyribose-phosphate aldolase